MTKLEEFQTIRTAKYANVASFIANPEPTGTVQTLYERISTLEELVATLTGV